GVSTATVSYVINNTRGASPEVRERSVRRRGFKTKLVIRESSGSTGAHPTSFSSRISRGGP
ncbi:MAG: LacI family DNA-binding transcriptional regulator, partial [Acidobacteria bacterium Pan2503]|nr:LacI family DNA-binding transcriptional regulator [Candidatus Acidoferrum panamensis]